MNSPETPDNEFKTLFHWLQQGGLDTSSLSLNKEVSGERKLIAGRNYKVGDTILSMPTKLLITTAKARQSKFAKMVIKQKARFDSEQSFLAVFLLQEHLTGRSLWKPYLDQLPENFDHIPIFYGDSEKHLLEGSACEPMIESRRQLLREEYYKINTIPGLIRFTPQQYFWARTAINTRSFSLNGQIAMAPLMDFANHAQQPNTKWGAFTTDTLHMIATKNIAQGDEINISYGKKNNRRFFVNYGFNVDDENLDSVSFTINIDAHNDYLLQEKKKAFGTDKEQLSFELGAEAGEGFLQLIAIMRSHVTPFFTRSFNYKLPFDRSIEERALRKFQQQCKALQKSIHSRIDNIYDVPDNLARFNMTIEYRMREIAVLERYWKLAEACVQRLKSKSTMRLLKDDFELEYQRQIAELIVNTQKATSQSIYSDERNQQKTC